MVQKNTEGVTGMVIQSHLLEQIFKTRGYPQEFLSELDKVGEELYPANTDKAVALLRELHERGAHVTFIPDYDMDGIMSGVIGMAGLAELGFYVDLFIPDPKKGYGFDAATIDELMAKHPLTEAIVTADVGVSCVEGVRRAKELGLSVLVTDHHIPTGGRIPEADVVVDPVIGDDPITQKHICGACVIYRVLEKYAMIYGDVHTVSQIRRLRVFAGVGTVSDSMPMLLDNRQMVRDAVSVARLIYSDSSHFIVDNMSGHPVYKRAFAGLHLILSQFAEAGKLRGQGDIDEEFFGFYLSPTFNSVKRMSADMELAFGVFFGNDPKGCAEELFRLNNERKTLAEQYMQDIEAGDHPNAPLIYVSKGKAGLMGLLASRLMQTGKGPCIVVREAIDGTTGEAVLEGSGRSPSWYPFVSRTREYQASHPGFMAAGHDAAFGFKVPLDGLDEFADWLRKDVAGVLATVNPELFVWHPDLVISTDGTGDTGIDIVEFVELMEDLQQFRPFGPGFETPRMALRFMPGEGEWSTIGSMGQHLKVILPYGLVALCWNGAGFMGLKDGQDPVVMVGRLNMNEFAGTKTVQFIGEVQ